MRNFFKRAPAPVPEPAVPALGHDLAMLLERVLQMPEGTVRVLTQMLDAEQSGALEWMGSCAMYDLLAPSLRRGAVGELIKLAAARGRFVQDVTESVHLQANAACGEFLRVRAQYAADLADDIAAHARSMVGDMTVIYENPVVGRDTPQETPETAVYVEHTIVTNAAVISVGATLLGVNRASHPGTPVFEVTAVPARCVPLGATYAELVPFSGRTLKWLNNTLVGDGIAVFLPPDRAGCLAAALPAPTSVTI